MAHLKKIDQNVPNDEQKVATSVLLYKVMLFKCPKRHPNTLPTFVSEKMLQRSSKYLLTLSPSLEQDEWRVNKDLERAYVDENETIFTFVHCVTP